MNDFPALAALTIHDVNDVRLDDCERGAPGPKDVVVRMKACGICGSDLSYIKMGGIPLPGTKTALGHEASGEVIEVGSEVTGHAVGQRVVINGMFVGSGGMEGAFTEELLLKDAEAMGKLLPNTTTLSPGLTCARLTPCMATASGSHSAAIS